MVTLEVAAFILEKILALVPYGSSCPGYVICLTGSTKTACYWAVPLKIDRRQSISVIGGRLKKKSTVGGRLRKKKGRKRGKKEAENTSPVRRRCPRVARAHGRFFSRARRRSVSPRGEKDREDVRGV
ncbi:hypothetical protein B296_00019496 [Ensete ventricosum]|uniref:Uncharacterized protein n=1 Tax=Ensete ventricosum TaxID=4639 RepID=A0A426ZW58_ENSVE|nr:hypothetical protein B296_00019496 [Ensete ventricosum]